MEWWREGETYEDFCSRMEDEFSDMTGILTPGNLFWDWFVDELHGPNGIDWRYADPDNPTPGETVNGCDAETQKYARAILEKMAAAGLNIDIERTLWWFKWKGGGCDCEILMNVDLHKDMEEVENE